MIIWGSDSTKFTMITALAVEQDTSSNISTTHTERAVKPDDTSLTGGAGFPSLSRPAGPFPEQNAEPQSAVLPGSARATMGLPRVSNVVAHPILIALAGLLIALAVMAAGHTMIKAIANLAHVNVQAEVNQ